MESTLTALNKLMVGDRFWFWFCAGVEEEQPKFRISVMESDPGMRALMARAKESKLAVGAIPISGLGHVSTAGFVQLSCSLASDDMLKSLAEWIGNNLHLYPELAKLKHAQLFNISPNGKVRSIHSDSSVWSTVPDMAFRGTAAETLQRLQKMKAGQDYWFWLAENGPGDKPFLHLLPVTRDPEGKSFVKQIVRLRQRTSGYGVEIKGIVQYSQRGTYVFTTENEIEMAQTLFAALAFPVLNDSLVIRNSGGRIAQTKNISITATNYDYRSDLSNLVRILTTLDSPGKKCLFWMGVVAEECYLLLANDKEKLKTSVQKIGKAQTSTRGQVVVSKANWLEFKTQSPYPKFIDQLIDWTCLHHRDWPQLSRLKGARMTFSDKTKTLLDRQKNSIGWKRLNG